MCAVGNCLCPPIQFTVRSRDSSVTFVKIAYGFLESRSRNGRAASGRADRRTGSVSVHANEIVPEFDGSGIVSVRIRDPWRRTNVFKRKNNTP